MEAAGIVVGLVQVITQTTSLLVAITSSAYNHRRILQEAQKSCEEIEDCFRELKDMIAFKETSVTSWEHLDSGLQKCQVLIDRVSSATTHSSLRLRIARRVPDSLKLMQLSESLEARCQREEVDGLMLWRLQSWITKLTSDRLPPSAHEWFTKTVQEPSPHVLLAGWIILAVAIIAFCGHRSDLRCRIHYIVGSMVVACVLGGLEGSGMATVILQNIPWCLAIGMLLHPIVQSVEQVWYHDRSRRWHVIPWKDVEMMTEKDQLF